MSTKEWITRWFYYEKKGSTEHVAPSLDELKRGNVREWLSWSLFSKSIEGLTPALEAELTGAQEQIAALQSEGAGQGAAFQAQIDALIKADVYHNFGFTDRRDESGITFKNQIVDEQRWRLQVNHYDHGNGICAADVDGAP